jgi:hypothetical protein
VDERTGFGFPQDNPQDPNLLLEIFQVAAAILAKEEMLFDIFDAVIISMMMCGVVFQIFRRGMCVQGEPHSMY